MNQVKSQQYKVKFIEKHKQIIFSPEKESYSIWSFPNLLECENELLNVILMAPIHHTTATYKCLESGPPE